MDLKILPEESSMSDTYRFRPAGSADYPKVIEMWMAGISSDRVAIASIADTWWKKLLFKYVAGRRIFVQDMDTYVIETDQGLCGYVGLQRDEDTISVFDWGLALHWDGAAEEAFQVLLDGILDSAYDNEETEYLVLGMEQNEGPVRTLVAQQDFFLLDYQNQQLVTDLPLANPSERGTLELSLALQVDRAYKETKTERIRVEYADQNVAEVVAAVHNSIPSRAKVYEIRMAEKPVGFVQGTTHQNQARFIYALEPELWGTEFEKLILTSFCTQLAKSARKVRIRTFSAAHMEASKGNMASLGLTWEDAAWERWVHLLYESELDEASPDAAEQGRSRAEPVADSHNDD